jgi:hypothetical protein
VSEISRPLTIAAAIRQWLAEDPVNRTQARLARQLDIPRSFVQDIIKGTKEFPDGRIALLPDPLCAQVAKIRRDHHLGLASLYDHVVKKRSVPHTAVHAADSKEIAA